MKRIMHHGGLRYSRYLANLSHVDECRTDAAKTAAAGSLLKIAYTIGERCYHAAEKLEGLEQARLSSSYQITSLRIVYKALSSNLHKYNCDVEENLSKSDKDAIRDILNDIARTTDNCEQIVTKLRKALQRKSNKTDLDSCREELNSSLNVIRTLQTAFVSLVLHLSKDNKS